ncbi:MAG: hypothetical protein QOJ13_1564 [Gaiellales bacterium]|nr:hypothetical protein [Gaiellales bacterium]
MRDNRHKYRRTATWLTVVVLLSGCGGSDSGGTPAPKVAPAPTINSVIDIGGYGLFLHCEGAGRPTVVFENGLGQTEIDWAAVRITLGSKYRACSYDRAGAGLSQPNPSGKSSAAQAADDLAKLLTAAKEQPPFLLVGWSYGGMVARVYSGQSPEQVAGLVLVDSSSEHQGDDGEQLLDGATVVDWPATVKQTSDSGALGELPLIVLTAAHHEGAPAGFQKKWMGWQTELAALSTNSLHVVATQSDHPILFQQPDIVAQAITDVAASIDAGQPIEACGDRYAALSGRCP